MKLHFGDVIIGSKVTVSQGTYLCSASHSIEDLSMKFISGPIIIHDYVWVGAEAFVKMDIVIGEGAIVGARSGVYKSLRRMLMYGGNPVKN